MVQVKAGESISERIQFAEGHTGDRCVACDNDTKTV